MLLKPALCILVGLSPGIASLSSGLSLEPWKVYCLGKEEISGTLGQPLTSHWWSWSMNSQASRIHHWIATFISLCRVKLSAHSNDEFVALWNAWWSWWLLPLPCSSLGLPEITSQIKTMAWNWTESLDIHIHQRKITSNRRKARKGRGKAQHVWAPVRLGRTYSLLTALEMVLLVQELQLRWRNQGASSRTIVCSEARGIPAPLPLLSY